MNRLMVYAICVLFACFMFSCSEKNSQKEIETKMIVELPDSVKQHLVEQDSLAKGLVATIDNLTLELNNAKFQIEQLEDKVNKLESPRRMWNYLIIVCFILCFICLVAILLIAKKIHKKRYFDNIIHEYLHKSETIGKIYTLISDLELRMTELGNIGNGGYSKPQSIVASTSPNISVLERRIVELEKLALTGKKNPQQQFQKNVSSWTNTCYAKINSETLFTEILDSCQEGCVYKIDVKGTTGEFDIISLDKIKSRNAWHDVIELVSGSCLMEEANSYKVVKLGTCKKFDDTTWEVTDKLKIKISK